MREAAFSLTPCYMLCLCTEIGGERLAFGWLAVSAHRGDALPRWPSGFAPAPALQLSWHSDAPAANALFGLSRLRLMQKALPWRGCLFTERAIRVNDGPWERKLQ